jgi:hypothetical protein
MCKTRKYFIKVDLHSFSVYTKKVNQDFYGKLKLQCYTYSIGLWCGFGSAWIHIKMKIRIRILHDLHQSVKSDPDPHQSAKPDPDPHKCQKPGPLEANNVALETHPGAVEAHNGAVKAYNGAVEGLK